jgi:hypothetical protein
MPGQRKAVAVEPREVRACSTEDAEVAVGFDITARPIRPALVLFLATGEPVVSDQLGDVSAGTDLRRTDR